MGYLFLSASLFCGGVKGYCGKKMSGYVRNVQSAVMLNLIRALLCTFISVCLVILTGNIRYTSPDTELILISALSGVATAIMIATWLLSVRKSAYMMLDVFLMMGTLVPTVMGYFIFSEPISTRQWIGFSVLLFAVLIMCDYNNSIKVKITPTALILLILCGLSNGTASLSQKMFVRNFPTLSVSVFNMYTYIFASLTLALFFLAIMRKGKVEFDNEGTKGAYIYVFIMAAMLTAHSYFNTLAASYLDSMHLYPLDRGASLVIATLVATFVFKEKLKLNAVIGIAMAFIALLIINL